MQSTLSPTQMTWLQRWHPAASVAAIMGFTMALLLIELVLVPDANLFFKEGYGVERVTVALYALALVLWFASHPPAGSWQVPLILLLMAFRELDFDKRFTEVGLLKLQYYLRPAPITDKLVGIILLVVVFYALWRLLRHNVGPWLRGLIARRPDAWLVFVAFACVFVAKAIDGIDRKMAGFGVTFSQSFLIRAGRIEEVLELVFILLVCLAMVLFAHRRDREPSPSR